MFRSKLLRALINARDRITKTVELSRYYRVKLQNCRTRMHTRHRSLASTAVNFRPSDSRENSSTAEQSAGTRHNQHLVSTITSPTAPTFPPLHTRQHDHIRPGSVSDSIISLLCSASPAKHLGPLRSGAVASGPHAHNGVGALSYTLYYRTQHFIYGCRHRRSGLGAATLSRSRKTEGHISFSFWQLKPFLKLLAYKPAECLRLT